MKHVLILGAGPSGLLAGWAAESCGYEPYFLDENPTRPNGESAGVFYLHDTCGLRIPTTTVRVSTVGTTDGYRHKVYGAEYTGHVSFPDEPYTIRVGDGFDALEQLWERYRPNIRRGRIEHLNELGHKAAANPFVISTIPLPFLFPQINFPYQDLFVYTARMATTLDTVQYNGYEADHWYRSSVVFGRYALEFIPDHVPDPRYLFNVGEKNGQLRRVRKVIGETDWNKTLFEHLPDNVLLAGRYGSWNKKMLTHDVYNTVRTHLILSDGVALMRADDA